MNEETLPIETVDYLMIKWKKLASWENPKYSGATIFIANIAYWYLNWTDSTTLNLTLWAALAVYLSMRFAQTIWPEISYEEKVTKVIDAGEGENGIPESEISFMVEETKNYFTILKELRKDSPGLFCLFTSGFLLLLSLVGSYVTLLPLMYSVMMGGLVLPLTFRKLKRESPWIMQRLEKFNIIVLIVLKDCLDRSKIKTEEWGKATLNCIEHYVAFLKEHSKRYANQVTNIEVGKFKSVTDHIENSSVQFDESTDQFEKSTDELEKSTGQFETITEQFEIRTVPFETSNEKFEKSIDKIEKIADNIEKSSEEE